MHRTCLLQLEREAKCELGRSDSEVDNGGFRERVFDFSLEIRAIQPSTVFGTRKKTVLRGAACTWVPDL